MSTASTWQRQRSENQPSLMVPDPRGIRRLEILFSLFLRVHQPSRPRLLVLPTYPLLFCPLIARWLYCSWMDGWPTDNYGTADKNTKERRLKGSTVFQSRSSRKMAGQRAKVYGTGRLSFTDCWRLAGWVEFSKVLGFTALMMTIY